MDSGVQACTSVLHLLCRGMKNLLSSFEFQHFQTRLLVTSCHVYFNSCAFIIFSELVSEQCSPTRHDTYVKNKEDVYLTLPTLTDVLTKLATAGKLH